MLKTIKQIAEELGVSKTAIRKHMDEDFRKQFATVVAGVIHVSGQGESLLKTKFVKTVCNKNSGTVSALIEMLKGELENKNEQIAKLTLALENTTASLKAAQALHVGTMQQAFLPEKKERSKKTLLDIFRWKTSEQNGEV